MRWSMIRGGTFPLRKPGTVTWLPMVLYALSRLGFSSSNDTSTVSFTRVGLRVSTALFTTGYSCKREAMDRYILAVIAAATDQSSGTQDDQARQGQGRADQPGR